ncbi:MAG: HEAT repeat domain-containing protein [Myxococcota bacterium]
MTPDPLLREEDRVVVLQALSAGDMTAADLAWEKDSVQSDGLRRDRWRVAGVEAILHDPMSMPADAARLTGAVSGDPAATLKAAADTLGVTYTMSVATPCEPAEKRAWRKLDPKLREAVCAALVAPPAFAIGEAEGTLRALLRPDGEEAWDASEAMRRQRALLAALPVDLGPRVAGALAALDAAGLARGATWPTTPTRLTFGDRVVEIGTTGRDTFTAAITLDPGGDDLHRDPGGTTVHVDLAGDDLWEGALGGTVGGIAVLVDVAGDDTYRAHGDASLGAGVAGVGVLVDHAGDDSYRGVATTQGAGFAGIGLLLDHAGSDTYDAAAYAQGYAGVFGYGALWDGEGDDLYRAGGTFPDMPTRYPDHTLSLSQGFSIGMRPEAGGGVGLLVDERGNDAYDADLFAQGCSYWFARGYLVDRAGNDRYHVFQYGQGSGIHLSAGGLFDLAGQDAYSAGNLAQGSSHDYSVGWLVDRAGDDVYAAMSTAQGGSLTNSATFFVDAAGDDAYVARLPYSRGLGRFDRNRGSVGVFVDVAGDDAYDGDFADDTVRRPWAYGVFVDGAGSLPPPDPQPPMPPMRVVRDAPPPSRPEASPEVYADLARADAIGCAAPPSCAEALAELAKGGPDAFARLLPALPRDVLAEQYTLDALLRAVRSPETDARLREIVLAHVAAGPTYPALRWAVKWLGELGVDVSASLDPAAKSEDPRLREALAAAILAWKTTPPVLDALATDPEPSVRAVAALALGAGGAPPERLVAMLSDPSVLVRFNAADALLARPPETVRPALQAAWKAQGFPTPAARRLVLEVLLRSGVRVDVTGDPDPWARRKQVSGPWRP